MSRIGRKPIPLPAGVQASLTPAAVEVQGPKGKLATLIPRGMEFKQESGALVVRPARLAAASEKESVELTNQEKANWGLARALVANAVRGVSEGFSKDMDIVGVGYKAEAKGKTVVFNLGYSHTIEFPVPAGIEITVEKNTRVKVSGFDRQQVGQVAAEIRALRPPDPYKQKGIRFVGEVLRKKAGKAAATTTK